MVPFITCQVSFGQNVSDIISGVDASDLNLEVQISSVKQPVKSNSVSLGDVPQCGTSAFDDHLDYSFVVLKDAKHGSFMRRIHV